MVHVGQIGDLLGVVLPVILGDHGGIGDQIVDEVGAHRARVALRADLDGGGAQGEDAGPAAGSKTVQIDGDVDAETAGQRDDVPIGAALDVDELVEGRPQPPAHVVIGVRAGETEDLETAAVVLRDYFRNGK